MEVSDFGEERDGEVSLIPLHCFFVLLLLLFFVLFFQVKKVEKQPSIYMVRE